MKQLGFETRAVHSGREDLTQLGVHVPPIDLSTTYPVGSIGSIGECFDALAHGGPLRDNPIYARLHNPTVVRFEKALAALEGAEESVAFGSGMAALTAVLLAARQGGTHVVACRPVYGGTDHLLASGLLGMEVTWTHPHHVAKAIRPDTVLVIIETPANPTLALIDIARVAAQAGGVPVLVDSTFATPVLLQPLVHGAALVLHSATKFLGGHGDVMGGVVATNAAWAARLRQVRIATGGVLHPEAGYMLHRGLATLPIRVREAQRGAAFLAERLASHPAVSRVWYPGLAGGDPEGLIGRQMKGPGSLLSFELAGGARAAGRVMERLELLTPAVSLGSVDTLIQHPASLTHRVVDAKDREAGGISEGMLRVSVGLENPEDLWADLQRALDGLVSLERLAG
ncbi:PLP-dependent aspartate aminotransferase family protein [Myxococcus sp. RHSTA-1-4]|uniref:trans-sulfuration enzyme family protein n=1 Tax=Myxococcus sp. RHSTA-1-4 TaxID=2874601 RepID=UPI001CBF9AC3|nr:aminotransferase class I/II-fold pyridoxal phosphate-dependent enzyme [Myxococcus sp. RHSTA-1-4]MBZ4420650.1 aminotransferase class I/II-fold pyridoxal phosphate-dependent enzyme [Myxococcus sp. RHSTA-1-4]